MRIPALTICQPWAWAILHGGKRIENRRWSTNYRGALFIHAGAGKSYLRDGLDYLLHAGGFDVDESQLTMGAVVGIASLERCDPLEQVDRKRFDPSGLYAEGPFCWCLDNVFALPNPVKCSGKQKLFVIPSDVAVKVWEQVPSEWLEEPCAKVKA